MNSRPQHACCNSSRDTGSQAVGAAAKLGLADQLADGPRSADDVATSVKAETHAVHRVMRMLASIGVFVMDSDERFRLTPLGDTLRTGVLGSMKNFAIAQTSPGHWLPWGQMSEAVRTGRSM